MLLQTAAAPLLAKVVAWTLRRLLDREVTFGDVASAEPSAEVTIDAEYSPAFALVTMRAVGHPEDRNFEAPVAPSHSTAYMLHL